MTRHTQPVHDALVQDIVDDYTTWLRSWGASDTTILTRRSVVSAHLREFPRGATTRDLEAVLGRYTGWTARTYYVHLRSAYGWATSVGLIEVDPTAGLRCPRAPRRRPRPLTETEAVLAIEAATGRVRAYLTLSMYAGLRTHEIAKLRGEDVSEDQLVVLGKGAREDAIPTHPRIWLLAQEYPREGYWFKGNGGRAHVHPQSVTKAVSRHFASLGIEGSLHRCRHLYGTRLLRSGANLRIVQELMRHEDLSTTANYLAVSEDERKSAILGLTA